MTRTKTNAKWSMPHPVAYLYRCSTDASFLKARMKDYCEKIQEVQKESDKISRRLFSKKPSKARAAWIRRMEVLVEEEHRYRTGFQLARCLWQLEGILFETYVALTKWRRSKNEQERLLQIGGGSSNSNSNSKGDGNNGDGSNDNDFNDNDFYFDNHDFNDNYDDDDYDDDARAMQYCLARSKLLLLEQREEDRSVADYEQCGFDQAGTSKEIGTYLGLDPSRGTLSSSSLPTACDEDMFEYTMRNYCHCSVCHYYFNKKDLGIFGQICKPASTTTDSNGNAGSSTKAFQGGSIAATLIGDVGASPEDYDEEDCDTRFRSFRCLECYKTFPNEQQEEDDLTNDGSSRAVAADNTSTYGCASIDATEQPSLDGADSNANAINDANSGENNSTGGNNGREKKPGTGKKRRKKKKKKKATTAPPLSSPPCDQEEERTATKKPTSCASPTSVILEHTILTEKKKDDDDDDNNETSDTLLEQPGSDSVVAIRESSVANSFLDRINGVSDNTNPAIGKTIDNTTTDDDPNELWVEYLWKTGSLIALDRYMDEVEGTLGTTDDCT